jgi:hypothetical protein
VVNLAYTHAYSEYDKGWSVLRQKGKFILWDYLRREGDFFLPQEMKMPAGQVDVTLHPTERGVDFLQ